ncbi:MAG: VanZ family protein [Pseudaminobacter sp.]
MLRTFLKITAWASLLAIAVVTLGPMVLRPETSAGPTFERLLAFAACGFLFAAAYPRRLWLIALMVVAAAITLEGLQLVIPGRHGHLSDLFTKIGGGLTGVLVVGAFAGMWRLYGPAPEAPYRD